MKKILFVIGNMKVGGTRKSLLNLMAYLSRFECEIDLLMMSHEGEYINLIPKNVNVIKESNWTKVAFEKTKFFVNQNKIWQLLLRIVYVSIERLLGKKKSYLMLSKFENNLLKKKYDCVIGFQEGEVAAFSTLLSGVHHSIWIHNNYEHFGFSTSDLNFAYDKSDDILFVSNISMQSFLKYQPQYSNKTRVIKNIVDDSEVRKRAGDEIDKNIFNSSKIRVIQVGRIAEQKGYERILKSDVLKRNKNLFDWVIIGGGDNIENLRSEAINQKLPVRFLGSKSNPYPYLASADLLFVSSLYESQPLVIIEALTLGIPVVTTNYDSAVELASLNSGIFVCENSQSGIENAISKIASGEIDLKKMKESARCFKYDNDTIAKEVLKLCEERKHE